MDEYRSNPDADAWAHSPLPEPPQPPPPAPGTPARTLKSLTTEAFGFISTAQRNGMSASDAITVGIRPFLERLLELERAAALRQPAPVAADGAGQSDFPTEIYICGQRYEIVPDGETVHAIHGMIVFDEGRIELNTQCDAELLRVTLLHEVIHGIDKMLVGDPGITSRLRGPVNDQLLRLTEPEVLALSQGLWMTLTDPRSRPAVDWMLGRSAGGAGHGERRYAVLATMNGVPKLVTELLETREQAERFLPVYASVHIPARVVPVLVTVLADDAAPAGADADAVRQMAFDSLSLRLAAADAARAAAEGEATRLREAITAHHAQKAGDRCREDDDRLYAAAGLPPCDYRVGDKAEMLKDCQRFIERRCDGGGWPTYAALEEALKWYADEANWVTTYDSVSDSQESEASGDRGTRARAALAAPAGGAAGRDGKDGGQ